LLYIGFWSDISMATTSWNKRAKHLVVILLGFYLLLVAVMFFFQRSLLYFPRHQEPATRLAPWRDGERSIGYRFEVPNPGSVWLMLHGNAGQAAERDYVLHRMSDQDSLFVLEYPGYGRRAGSPSLASINQAASDAFRLLRARNPDVPVCVLGESLGSGPACRLALEENPPDKIVLMVPFDSLASVASGRFFFLPVRPLLWDAWDNVEALRRYAGPVDIYGATEDTVIPVAHARSLAEQVSGARFIPIECGHNEWSRNDRVRIRR
jgi:pimeloyl-ACP methyl ester carboxylesterase